MRHVVHVTGTGCLKFRKKIADELPVDLRMHCNEMECMARGLDTLWRNLPSERLLHQETKLSDCVFTCPLRQSGLLPCLLVSMGSAMTIVQIDADGTCSGVIGGSSLGGLTFLGLGCVLTKAKTVDELVSLAERGDRTQVDLRVKDITVTANYAEAGSDDMISSFGKAAGLMTSSPGADHGYKPEDLAHSLLYAVTDQLAQTVYLVAKAQRVNNVVFCGSYLTLSPLIKQEIIAKFERSLKYLPQEICPVFLQHETHLGCIGLLFNPPSEAINGSLLTL